MKRILYLHAGAEMYGADKVLLELIKGLDSKEFEAHVILPNDGVLVEALRQVGAQVSVLDYPILRRKYFNPKGIADYIRSYNFYAKQIALYAREHSIDMVHNNTAAVLEGIYLKRKLKLPLIWHVHEIIVKPKAISDFINMLMGRYADKIVTVSQAVANHIKQSSFIKDSQVEVIYNGVDNAVYYPMDASSIREKFDIAQDALVIGMIGRVNAIKGQNDFIEAVEPLLEKNEQAVAFLAGGVFPGEEWRLEELDKRIASSSVVSQIHRIDYYDKTSELYNMFDIFVLPSIKPDSLPTVVLEAMACSKPVVGYNNGGIAEMVVDDKSGCLVKPNRPQELSNAISLLLDSSEKREKFGRVGYQRQKELFSLESYIKNFSELYKTDRKD
ncbi:glycosyltransferase family 4 protein [Streptococcus sanguinis]|jgi:N-acetylgalactosamine transferase|uniref:N-acetylgalactosamine transferase n=2 Tax=Streptococcus sanguinis TaxID=1305 RepID=F3UDW4_STRSA|nr:glycosyltransferase family 4 protein [Streptococcus sanguinis]EGJ37940.1 N-acetylgalactosamine transferase [Streptococcus sanguinis SK1056]EGJ43041.1 N-acetylgalactosamine transferase [Streptococcus sanguinis SK1059]EGQ19007.1 N-acetylgalactosamine transferase [Streptococcus sanguinis ATCC 29667]EGQ23028.1 N-acetylgalactosamine transferase [Streptococcus sanguinis SK340]SQF33682.1 glycosyl transferase family protein [Streptococcus sanguinis]